VAIVGYARGGRVMRRIWPDDPQRNALTPGSGFVWPVQYCTVPVSVHCESLSCLCVKPPRKNNTNEVLGASAVIGNFTKPAFEKHEVFHNSSTRCFYKSSCSLSFSQRKKGTGRYHVKCLQ
jgi:hypothetical protein